MLGVSLPSIALVAILFGWLATPATPHDGASTVRLFFRGLACTLAGLLIAFLVGWMSIGWRASIAVVAAFGVPASMLSEVALPKAGASAITNAALLAFVAALIAAIAMRVTWSFVPARFVSYPAESPDFAGRVTRYREAPGGTFELDIDVMYARDANRPTWHALQTSFVATRLLSTVIAWPTEGAFRGAVGIPEDNPLGPAITRARAVVHSDGGHRSEYQVAGYWQANDKFLGEQLVARLRKGDRIDVFVDVTWPERRIDSREIHIVDGWSLDDVLPEAAVEALAGADDGGVVVAHPSADELLEKFRLTIAKKKGQPGVYGLREEHDVAVYLFSLKDGAASLQVGCWAAYVERHLAEIR